MQQWRTASALERPDAPRFYILFPFLSLPTLPPKVLEKMPEMLPAATGSCAASWDWRASRRRSSCGGSTLGMATGALGVAGAWALKQTGSASSLGALAEQSRLQTDKGVRLQLSVEADFDLGCWVSLEAGQVDGPDLPLIIAAGRPCSVRYIGEAEGVAGSLVLEGFRDAIPFEVLPGGRKIHFGDEHINHRSAVTMPSSSAEDPMDSVAGDAPLILPPGAAGAPGATAELQISQSGPSAQLLLRVRRATEAEVRRQAIRSHAAPAAGTSPA